MLLDPMAGPAGSPLCALFLGSSGVRGGYLSRT